MIKAKSLAMLFIVAVFVLGFYLGRNSSAHSNVSADTQAKRRIFEIRTYTTEAGKLEALQARFRNHTMRLFEKHGMTNIGYWVPQDAPQSQNTLIYILAHQNREVAAKSWEAFRNDPEWKKVREASEANGKIVSKLESVYMEATDYSPIK